MRKGDVSDYDFGFNMGTMVARMDSGDQADFFKGFAAECLAWGQFAAQMQLHAIRKKIDDSDATELLALLGTTGE